MNANVEYDLETDQAAVIELLKEGMSLHEACLFLVDSRGYKFVDALVCVDGALSILNPGTPSPFAVVDMMC